MVKTYPADWHRLFGEQTGHSAAAVMRHLLSIFDVTSTVEIGCGNAHWTRAGLDLGVQQYLAADGDWNDLRDLLVDQDRFVAIDLAHPLALSRRFDLAICLEVAEHVGEEHAETIVDSLVRASDVILFGAAVPFQGGSGHINEQWASWWRERFSREGFVPFDLVRPKFWADRSIHYWYRQNPFVYVKRCNAEATRRVAEAQRALYAEPVLFDAVVPEKFEELASYRAIVPKRLARQLPAWVARRLRAKVSGMWHTGRGGG